MKTCIYSGSFDPCTLGHVHIIKKSLDLFDKVYVAIGVNSEKKTTFNLEDRKAMIKNAFPNEQRIEIIDFSSQFMVNVCRQYDIKFIVRGVRNVKDFEYEKQIDEINTKINSEVQTIFMFPPNNLAGLSSSMVKGLIGNSEWQFVVQDMIPKVNMSYMMNIAYPDKFIRDILINNIYHLSGEADILNINSVIEKYNDHGRYYHTIQHITEMLKMAGGNDFTDLVLQLAIIFHDVVYDPKSSTNEEDSVKELLKINLSKDIKQRVTDLIMVTKTHQTNDSPSQNLMVDLDLAILGSDIVRFNEYERQIRHEYGFVSDELYNAGRIDFIKKLLSRPSIFLTDEFKAKYEFQARTNLNKLIISLEKK